MRLVFVHGRSQQGKDPDELKGEWLAALEKGLQKNNAMLPPNVEVRLPFYGNRLSALATEFDVPLTEDFNTKGGDADADFLEFEAAVAEAVRDRAGIKNEQVDEIYGEIPKTKGPQNWRWVQAILRALDEFSPGLSGKALQRFTRDVYFYTNRTGVKTEINQIVAAELTEQEPNVVVGHSLGSVVAYSVLREDPRPLQVTSLVTLGCPLGIRPIRNQFAPLKFPKPIRSWYNAYDDRDVVALYALDRKNFPLKPEVTNYSRVKNHTANRHGIAGYLDDPAVSQVIHAALS
jgi:hypothetical protein